MGNRMTFGGWLRQRRKAAGITQDELAERLAFSSTMLWKMEADERRPSRQIAQLLAGYFNVPEGEREAFVNFARTGRSDTASVSFSASQSDGESDGVLARAPWRGSYLRQGNLPSILTPLIGRDREVAVARDLILRPKTRLLTFTGPPGIGKTRLALAVAWDLMDLVDRFGDGVFFVDLAPVVDPDQVLPTVGRTLGLNEALNQPIERVLVEFVRERRMLLLLDNFEQVLDAATGVVRLMEASPWLKVLITSREALRVRGERRLLVPPLTLPDLRHLPPVQELFSYPSVELFVERAQEVQLGFELAPDNAEDVAALCVGLDGVPLVIELAAARADHLTPRQMRAGLDSRLTLLTARARDVPTRQRTLRGAIEWSYGLLSESERRLFRGLSVFVDGCTLDAIEVVCAVGSPDGVWSLVDKSLLRQQEGVGDQARFTMLETLREYAHEKLQESGEAATLEELHAAYFLHMAEESERELMGPRQVEWIERLDREYANLRKAMGMLLLQGDYRKALRLGGALHWYWNMRGYITEGRTWLETILARSGDDEATLHRGKALTALGYLMWLQGDWQQARAIFEEGLAIFRTLGNKQEIAGALHGLGGVARERGEYARARAYYEESLALRREVGDLRGVSTALVVLGLVDLLEGAIQNAKAKFEESLAISRTINSKWDITLTLQALGNVAMEEGDWVQAKALLEEGLQIARELGFRTQVAVLITMGFVELQQGNWERATAPFQESLLLGPELGAVSPYIDAIEGLASIAGMRGKAERAARLFAAEEVLRTKEDIPILLYFEQYRRRLIADARAKLGEEAWARAWQAGSALTLEEAIAYALSDED